MVVHNQRSVRHAVVAAELTCAWVFVREGMVMARIQPEGFRTANTARLPTCPPPVAWAWRHAGITVGCSGL